MENKETKPIEIATLILSAINILILGIGGYVFVGRQEADMYRSSTDLNNIQFELSKIKLDVAKSNAQIDALIKSATITEKSIELLEAVRPKVDFRINPNIEYKNGYLTIAFELVNNGEYELLMQPTRLIISNKLYRSNLTKIENSGVWSENIDLQQIEATQTIGPNEKRTIAYTVKLKNNTPKIVYYYMEYLAETRADVVQLIDGMARQLGLPSVLPSSKQVTYRYGTLNL
ncbi:hypothetical protein HNO86_17735 [Pseudomonas sp. C1C7]|uniref:hypothetical protein n=1 Tax=Pseudomonas sp. C1C7 TaxID=2735272 RepID=UPI001586AEC7|nr:hypothetical protein [Pseudomonas sp. C1C7]NUT76884.1 hypothetical protein [Pseudomonas sp. C1C7]